MQLRLAQSFISVQQTAREQNYGDQLELLPER